MTIDIGSTAASASLWPLAARARLFLAALICNAALIGSPAFAAQRRLEVLPIIFVPSDNHEIQEKEFPDYMLQIYRNLVLAQRHWLNVLDTDTFAISPFGEVYHAKQPHAYYDPSGPEAANSASLVRQLIEIFQLKSDNRVDSAFAYLIVYARPKAAANVGPMMGGARTFNGMPDTGGGAVQMELSSLILDQPYPFQSTIVHELGHTFGLTHPDCHGYSLTENPSMMSYNPKHHSHGLAEGPEYAGLNPEDFFVIGQNKLAFPNFRYVESIHNPRHKPLTNIEPCYLGPMTAAIGGDPKRKLHGVGYELFFNSKLVSGPEASFMSHDEANANCQENIKNNRGRISIECRYNGKRFAP
jgi:hypothetical protein